MPDMGGMPGLSLGGMPDVCLPRAGLRLQPQRQPAAADAEVGGRGTALRHQHGRQQRPQAPADRQAGGGSRSLQLLCPGGSLLRDVADVRGK